MRTSSSVVRGGLHPALLPLLLLFLWVFGPVQVYQGNSPQGCPAPPTASDAGDELPSGGVDFNVTVAVKNATHPLFNVGNPSGFVINGVQGALLNLTIGQTYIFAVNTIGHPFIFTTSALGGFVNTAQVITDGVVNSGAQTGQIEFTPNANHPSLIYYHCDAHEGMGWRINILQPVVAVSPKVFLEGPFNSGTQTMSDALRVAALVPLTEPYTALGYTHEGGGGETTTAGVLAVTGNNAIVDWVVVELRDAGDPAIVLATRSALLQRDGDVVATNGTSPVQLAIGPDDYHVAVRHRTHFGVMTAATFALSPTTTAIDLTVAGTPCYGTDPRKAVGATQVLWAGDVNRDGQLKYSGSANDRDLILVAVGGSVPTATTSGYSTTDVNMDGITKYSGSANDRDPVLVNIGGAVPTATRTQQLP